MSQSNENQRLCILFVCAKNQWRSPTAEQIYRKDPRLHVRSAGLSPKSRHQLKERDLIWADIVLVMEQEHKSRILKFYRESCPQIECLDIPDEYEYMNEELVELLIERVDVVIEREIDLEA